MYSNLDDTQVIATYVVRFMDSNSKGSDTYLSVRRIMTTEEEEVVQTNEL
jgi:hypothetical protein